MRASGTKRPWSAPFSGMVNTVSGSDGCATMESRRWTATLRRGSPSLRPASSLRSVPQWFCRTAAPDVPRRAPACGRTGQSRGTGRAGVGAHAPVAGLPAPPPSSGAKQPTDEMPTQSRSGSVRMCQDRVTDQATGARHPALAHGVVGQPLDVRPRSAAIVESGTGRPARRPRRGRHEPGTGARRSACFGPSSPYVSPALVCDQVAARSSLRQTAAPNQGLPPPA